jgi:hypothetical protein
MKDETRVEYEHKQRFAIRKQLRKLHDEIKNDEIEFSDIVTVLNLLQKQAVAYSEYLLFLKEEEKIARKKKP